MEGRAMFASYGMMLMIMLTWQYSAGADQMEPETKGLKVSASPGSKENRKFMFGAERMTITQTQLTVVTSTVPYICITTANILCPRRRGRGICEIAPVTDCSKRRRQLSVPDDSLPANLLASSMEDAGTLTENSAGVDERKERKLFTVWKTKHTYVTITHLFTDTSTTIGLAIVCSDLAPTYPDCR